MDEGRSMWIPPPSLAPAFRDGPTGNGLDGKVGRNGRFARSSTAEDPVEHMEGLRGTVARRRLRPRGIDRGQATLQENEAFGVRKKRRQGREQNRRRNQQLVGHDGPHPLRAGARRQRFLHRRGIRPACPLLAASRPRFLLRSGQGAATDRIPDQQHHEQGGDCTQHHSAFVPQRRDLFNRNRFAPQ